MEGEEGGEGGEKRMEMRPPSKIHVYVNVGVTTVYMYCLE